ncbi:MAG: cell division protein FtsZ [Bacteroidetes bacterium]|nr:cell division protein FtsZ [Bacteroidota bacterium]
MLHFDLPKEQSSIIKVIGVGGGGSNAVNHMFEQGIEGVNFVICNTDEQALEHSQIPNKIHLGPEITQGLGAGSVPELGRKATEESAQMVKDILNHKTEMVFITAGMGGGTGTGGAPIVAKIAKEMGILTVGIVTTPFSFEGQRKIKQAMEGIEQLKQHVDTIIVISNDKIREIYGNLKQREAFAHADNILSIAARSISEIITNPGIINIDFADIKFVMSKGGTAIMGTGAAEGEDRAFKATSLTLNSPLLNNNDVKGAEKVLINISSSEEHEVRMDEIDEITNTVKEAAGKDIDVIFGTCDDSDLGETLSVTIIATGFNQNSILPSPKQAVKVEEKVVIKLEEPKVEETPETLMAEPVQEVNHFDLFSNKIDEHTYEIEVNNPEMQEEVQEEESGSLDFKVYEKHEEFVNQVPPANPSNFITPKKRDILDDEFENRKDLLRSMSYDYTNNTVLNEMEKVPAYLRKNEVLGETPSSEKTEKSRYTLREGEDGNIELGKNSFLYDNVD